MNKGDLAAAVASRTGTSKAAAADAVDAVFDTITDSLGGGTEVRILGFGNFAVTHRKASMGRNPQTGDSLAVPSTVSSPSPVRRSLVSGSNPLARLDRIDGCGSEHNPRSMPTATMKRP